MDMSPRILIGIVAVTLSAGCATTRVETDFDRAVDFGALSTFAWTDPVREEVEDPVLDSELLTRKVRRAAIAALQDMGYQEADPGDADFFVTYHTSSRERHFGSEPRMMIALGGAHGRLHQTVFISDGFGYRSYQEGTLIIDVIDAGGMQLVWRGWTRGFVSKEHFTDEAVAGKVEEILGRFPPGP